MLFFILLALTSATPSTLDLQSQFQAHIRFLAHDHMAGRATGAFGQRIAAQYLASQLRLMGVQGAFPDRDDPYIQPFTLYGNQLNTENTYVASKRRRAIEVLQPYRHFWPLPFGLGNFEAEGDLVFAGLGFNDEATYSDLKSLDLKDKWIVILRDLPEVKTGPLKDIIEADAVSLRLRIMVLMTMGAKGVVILTPETTDAPALGAAPGLSLEAEGGSDAPRRIIMVPKHSWQKLFGKDYARFQKAYQALVETGQPASFETKQTLQVKFDIENEAITSENVAAVIPGTDPVVGHETIVISAHYDHIGEAGAGVYNGADDNGTGTTMLLLLAQALKDTKPRRSLMFLWVTAEENGLVGSEYFLQAPPIDQKHIIANINMDMLGRNDPYEIGIIPAKVKGISSLRDDLKSVNTQQPKAFNLLEDFDRYNSRSDHFSFLKAEIPALFLFSGVHDDYHAVTDDWDTLDYGKLARLHRLLSGFLTKIAAAEEAPVFLEADKSND